MSSGDRTAGRFEGPLSLAQLQHWRRLLLAGEIQLRGLPAGVDARGEGLRWIDEQLAAHGTTPEATA